MVGVRIYGTCGLVMHGAASSGLLGSSEISVVLLLWLRTQSLGKRSTDSGFLQAVICVTENPAHNALCHFAL